MLEKSGNVATIASIKFWDSNAFYVHFKRANDPFVDCCFKHLRYVKRGRNFVPCYDVIFVYSQKMFLFNLSFCSQNNRFLNDRFSPLK